MTIFRSSITRPPMRQLAAVAMTLSASWLFGVANAHHSFAQFDSTKSSTLSGTVRVLEWNNPHVWLWIDVPDNAGGTAAWGFEGAAPGGLARHGFDKTLFHRGDAITVSYHPMRNGKPGGSFMVLTLADGKKLEAGGPPQGLIALPTTTQPAPQ